MKNRRATSLWTLVASSCKTVFTIPIICNVSSRISSAPTSPRLGVLSTDTPQCREHKGCSGKRGQAHFWAPEDYHNFFKAFLRSEKLVDAFIKPEALVPGYIIPEY